jgi:hypothetical protein
MSDQQWIDFFQTAYEVLLPRAKGPVSIKVPTMKAPREVNDSWCSWTTFSRMGRDSGYWTKEIPDRLELGRHGLKDGGIWTCQFEYCDLAHVIIPKEFSWEFVLSNGDFFSGSKQQDIELLSSKLSELLVPHLLTKVSLEVKVV